MIILFFPPLITTHFVVFRLPWNCKTPIGYIGEIIFHVVTGQIFLFVTGIVILLFIAMCLHHQAFYQMYCHSLQKFECIITKQNHKKHLCELIRFHVSAKRLVAIFFIETFVTDFNFIQISWMLISAEAYSLFMLVKLIVLTVCIGIIFFMFDMVRAKKNVFLQNIMHRIR